MEYERKWTLQEHLLLQHNQTSTSSFDAMQLQTIHTHVNVLLSYIYLSGKQAN
jgi:hypothetical protein